MRLLELGGLYALVGVGCALAVALRPGDRSHRVVDAVLVMTIWPLYGPFLVARWSGADGGTDSEVEFLATLRRVQGTPLAALLPDERTVRLLATRLRVAADKVDEIDRLLQRPEFDERDALRRVEELKAKGASDHARSTANLRVQNIRRLRSLRDRFASELDEVGELLKQLKTQAEVVRLAGAPDPGARDLVQEILSRVEGLDHVLDDDPYASGFACWSLGTASREPPEPLRRSAAHGGSSATTSDERPRRQPSSIIGSAMGTARMAPPREAVVRSPSSLTSSTSERTACSGLPTRQRHA